MKNKIINLCVFVSKTPCVLKIFSSDGFLVFKKTLYKNKEQICLCINSPYLNIWIKHNNQTIQKYVGLFDVCFQKANVSFIFQNSFLIQNFLLVDENYNLPVLKAVLRFEN